MPTYEGVELTMDMVPPAAKELVPIDVTTNDFNARLVSGGTMELVDTNWTVGDGPDYGSNRNVFLALDTLKLVRSAIVTNGNTVTIFTNKLISNDGKIVSFAPAHRKAKRGGNADEAGEAGSPGVPGDSGGVVSIHVIGDFDGTLDVNLSGQDGGDGGEGKQGAKGAKGAKGQNAVSDGAWCRRGGQNGGRGGAGLPGGNGGDGGAGGQGGNLYIFRVNQEVGEGLFSFKSDAGLGGASGAYGEGGPGGQGGDGGNGDGSCGGGHGGGDGRAGLEGEPGARGVDGAEGRAITKSLELEVTIRMATAGPRVPTLS